MGAALGLTYVQIVYRLLLAAASTLSLLCWAAYLGVTPPQEGKQTRNPAQEQQKWQLQHPADPVAVV